MSEQFNLFPIPEGLSKLFLEYDSHKKQWAAMAIVGDWWYKAWDKSEEAAMRGLYHNIRVGNTLAAVPKVTMKQVVKPSEKEKADVDELSKLLGL